MSKQEIIYLTPAEARRLEAIKHRYREEARRKFEERVTFYHPLTGGRYTSITIRDQKTRWRSCSSRGTLSFNYRLVFAPPKVLDYVVVHELAHRREMNHSQRFWRIVAEILPDYQERRRKLREYGHLL